MNDFKALFHRGWQNALNPWFDIYFVLLQHMIIMISTIMRTITVMIINNGEDDDDGDGSLKASMIWHLFLHLMIIMTTTMMRRTRMMMILWRHPWFDIYFVLLHLTAPPCAHWHELRKMIDITSFHIFESICFIMFVYLRGYLSLCSYIWEHIFHAQ